MSDRDRNIRVVSTAEAKAHLSAMVEDVFNNGTRYVVKRFDQARAVLIPMEDFRRLLELEQTGQLVMQERGPIYQIGEPQSEDDVKKLLNMVDGADEP
jgi:PHD/YefM family antitoxin component YafN of YafNO toxin-antitoxin module